MSPVSALALLAVLAAPGDGTRSVPTTERSVPASETTLLQFSSQRCQHCQAMQPIVAQLVQQGVHVQPIDVDQQLSVARQYQINGVPTFVAVGGGRELGRIEGVTSYEKLVILAKGSGFGVQGSGVGEQGAPGAALPISPDQSARSATVRVKVEDVAGYGFGTGTIIDTHDSESLVVTCGHLFRESKGKGKITADIFSGSAPQTVDGQLIGYDLDRDIALISIRSGQGAPAVKVAPPGYTVRPGDRVFTIGCDKGADPSIRPTHITAVNKYRGKPNFTAAGQPIDGRSGGGLFTAEGYLIGICNAADPTDDEGLYAGLASIHWQLDQIGQSEIYQRAALAAVMPTAAPVGWAVPTSATTVATPSSIVPTSSNVGPDKLAQARISPPPSLGLAPIAAGDDTEIVFIVRSKRDPSQRSEVYVVDQAPPDLLARITHAARATGEQRAALARTAQPPIRTAAASPPRTNVPVVRGQSSDF